MALPIPTYPNLESLDVSASRLAPLSDELVAAGWFYPPYISQKVLSDLARELRGLTPDERERRLAIALQSLYAPFHFAAMISERYRKVPIISPFSQQIEEAVIAKCSGSLQLATAGLVPVIEGILRAFAVQRGEPLTLGQMTDQILKNIDALGEAQKPFGASEERLVMLRSFRIFFRRNFWVKTNQASPEPHGVLNRHGILHGIFNGADFGHDIHFNRLISCVDMLTFMGTFTVSGVSMLTPEHTDESFELAAHLLLASNLGLMRKKAVME